MKLRIEIDCDGATFQEDSIAELRQLLDTVMQVLERDGFGAAAGEGFALLDSNGNTIGRARLFR